MSWPHGHSRHTHSLHSSDSTLYSLQSTLYSLTRSHAPSRKIQLHYGKIKNLHNGNSTKSNRMQLYNSISRATDYCTDSVHLYTL